MMQHNNSAKNITLSLEILSGFSLVFPSWTVAPVDGWATTATVGPVSFVFLVLSFIFSLDLSSCFLFGFFLSPAPHLLSVDGRLKSLPLHLSNYDERSALGFRVGWSLRFDGGSDESFRVFSLCLGGGSWFCCRLRTRTDGSIRWKRRWCCYKVTFGVYFLPGGELGTVPVKLSVEE